MSYFRYMKSIIRLGSSLLALGAPMLASAATITAGISNNGWFFGIGSGQGFGFGGLYCGSSSICSVANTFLYLINNVLVPLLFAIAFIAFLWGIAKAYIISGGNEEERQKGHQILLWGLVGFVVMISLWGLVNIISNTFGLSGYRAPLTPTSFN